MDKSISIDELNSICKKMNELNDRISNHDQNSRNLYEEITWSWRNDNKNQEGKLWEESLNQRK